MNYPTLEQVEAANQMTLCCWYRFLPIPDNPTDGKLDIINRIFDRVHEGGGFTPEISKAIGWDSR